ncbi:AraC family transcriptional regulator [Luteibacter aegosomaticola]|uniref:helix-turn-helix domain-containing protein n=1 Tax=Luteibacter aegosomaticola TaxID=2911538 RepID=UPI001FF738BD|nr:AraC family transcriptional regulator [Luteibacter aegosomaticola]UPG88228.1 AraC family transcriptional regulator [Luteibacter aegosomaticola]
MLLGTTHERVGAISSTCGFSDQAHFTRVFKASTGLTPLAYRARYTRHCPV